MTEVEQRFRESERELDKLLLAAKMALNRSGIEITDWSGRKYHYKNERLSWDHWFVAKRSRGSEIEKVTVRIEMTEEDPDSVTVATHSEIFQTGKTSRWRSSMEEVLFLQGVSQRSVEKIVLDAVHWGQGQASRAD